MNDDLSNDSEFQAFEARLSRLRPELSARQSQELLYQCGLAAGRRRASRRLRHWQFASATLGVLLALASVSLVKERTLVARQDHASEEPRPAPPPEFADIGPGRRAPARDAWRIPSESVTSFEAALDRFSRRDAGSRSMTVGSMARAAQNTP